MHVRILYLCVLNVGNRLKCFIRDLDPLDFRHLRLQLSAKLYLSMQLSKHSVREVLKTFTFTFTKPLYNSGL